MFNGLEISDEKNNSIEYSCNRLEYFLRACRNAGLKSSGLLLVDQTSTYYGWLFINILIAERKIYPPKYGKGKIAILI